MRSLPLFLLLALSATSVLAVQVTVQTNPPGLVFFVDSVMYTSTQTFDWIPGSQHTISTTRIQTVSTVTRYVWQNWSDGGDTTRVISTPTIPSTYTANFRTEYYLTTTTSTPYACATPSSGWFVKDTIVTINTNQCQGPGQVYFEGWTGSGQISYSGSNKQATIIIQGPITQTATWNFCNVTITPTIAYFDHTGGRRSFVLSFPSSQCYASSIQTTDSWFRPAGEQFIVDSNITSSNRTGAILIFAGFHSPSAWLTISQSAISSTRWEIPITVRNGCTDSAHVYIGQKTDATDGIDPGLGEAELPPVPPTGVFDARLVLPEYPGVVASMRDYRRDTLSIVTWRVRFQAGSCGCPLIFRWNRNLVPSNAVVTLKDEITGSLVNVDMKTDSIYTLTNCAISSLMIEYRRMVRRDVALTSGWNIMSMPVQATDMRKSMFFPSAASPAYRYSNGYISADTLKPAIGYWLKAGSATTTSMYGTRFANQTIPLTAGWNIVGPFDRTVAVNAVTGTPSGILQSPFYGYSNGYTVADSLRVGKGYWVKASQAGSLSLGPVYGKVGEQMTVQTDNWLRIEVEDNGGAATSVYLAKPDEIGRNFELPPVAPTGITDIRFEGDLLVENIEKHRFVLHANSTAYPLVIKIANARGETFGIKDLVTGTLLDATLREGGPVVVSLPLGKLELTRLGTAVHAPVAFALGQNYPNPFNPKTKIQFALPKDSDAKLTVYNTLGERVTELANGRFVAGYHDVEFDATNYASGVYYYRIEAGSFVSVKKMLVLK